MATKNLNQLTTTASAASGDLIAIWRVGDGDTRAITKANFMGGVLTGGGTIATGGFTLTVAANSTINGSVVGNMTGSGTVATGGNTLTVGGTSTINGSVVGNMTGSGTVATGGFTLTVPATGTAALLGTAQTFSAANTFSAGITTAVQTRISGTNVIDLKPGTAGSIEVLDITTPTSNKNVGVRLLPSGTATQSQIEMWNDSDTSNGGRVNISANGDALQFEPAVSGTGTTITKIVFASGDTIIGGTTPAGQLHVDQSSTTGAKPVLVLDQADLSEEFIEFVGTVGAGNSIDTAAIGTYYGKIRVNVSGVGYKYIPLHNT